MGRDIARLLTSSGFLIDDRRRSQLGMLDEIVGRRAGASADAPRPRRGPREPGAGVTERFPI
jgi:hypothetical protein